MRNGVRFLICLDEGFVSAAIIAILVPKRKSGSSGY